MESEGKRLYSVHTRAEIRDLMMKEIVQISEVFSLSQSDATLTLIRLGWDSLRASDVLEDNKEKFLSKLGLVGGDNLVSTPLCSHKFCSDCWRSESLEKEDKNEMMISCLKQACVVSVGPDTEEPVKKMYERYVLGSFMDSSKIKWCPASGCEYAVKRHDDNDDDDDDGDEEDEEEGSDDLGVVCLCGHTFCWKCKLESHRPVTCNNASLWLNDLLEEARELSENPKTTKPCPSCNSNMQKLTSVPWRIVTCHCSHAFCWRCLRAEEDHREILLCGKVHVPPPSNEVALLRHHTLWEEYHKSMEASKLDLEAIELHSIPLLTSRRGLGESDMRALREACVLIVQCKRVLKWSCLFGYFITDYNSGKKKYLDHLRGVATTYLLKHKESVDELVKEAISGGDIRGFRHKMETSTTATGNYFHYFVKTVEGGLSDVKGGVFEDVATDYWFCDRCTFQNDSFEQKCRVCVFPFEGPSPLVANNNSIEVASPPVLSFDLNESAQGGSDDDVAFGNKNNNNTASSGLQQGVPPPYMSSNPFAREGGVESAPFVAFGNSDDSVHRQQGANMSYNPFAREVGANRFASGPVAFGNSVPNLVNNPFAASPGGRFYVPMSSRAHQHPNMGNNAFASSREGPIFYQSPPAVVAYQEDQVPNMANLNPFARPGRTFLSQSAPFVAFGDNNNNGDTASARQQQAPDMMMVNNPFARQGGANNSSASGHQQQASNMPSGSAFALVKEEPKP